MNPKCNNHDRSFCAICFPFLYGNTNHTSLDDELYQWQYQDQNPGLLSSSLPPEPLRTRFHVSDCSYGGKRVWVEWTDHDHDGLDSVNKAALYAVLDNLSKWGGADKYESGKYVCWEIEEKYMPNVRRAMNRYMHVEDTARIPEWLA